MKQNLILLSVLFLGLLQTNIAYSQTADSVKDGKKPKKQKTKPITLDTAGRLTSSWSEALHLKSPDVNPFKDAAFPKTPINKKAFYKKLLTVAQSELDSLDKNANGIADRYKTIFGKNYQKIHDNLLAIRNCLSDPENCNSDDGMVIKSIVDTLGNGFSLKTSYEPVKKQMVIDVVQADPFKTFLIAYYKKYFDKLASLRLAKDDDKKARKELLNQLYTGGLFLQEETLKGSLICQDSVSGVRGKILNNLKRVSIYSTLAENEFVTRTLWLNGGVFRINPFSTPVMVDQKKADLFDKIIQARIDSVARCCENDPVKIEALIKALNSGKSRFKISDGTTAFGFKSLEEIKQANNIVNHVLAPVILDKQNCNCPGYAQPYRKRWVISYDAANKYITSFPCVEPAVPEDEEVVVAVNNVPAKTGVNILYTDAIIADKSNAQNALADLGTDLGTAATNITPLASVLPAFLASIAPVPVPKPVAINTFAAVTKNTPADAKLKILNQVMFNSEYVLNNKTKDSVMKGTIENINFYTAHYYIPKQDRSISIIVRNTETHIHFLKDYIHALYPDNTKKEQAAVSYAEYYGINCNPGIFKIKGDTSVILSQTLDVIKGFSAMVDLNKNRENDDRAIKALLDDYNRLMPFVNVDFPDLSNVTLTAGGTPAFKTVISSFPKAKAPIERGYTIQTEDAKPVKSGSASKTGDPSAADSVKMNILSSSYKVGKKYYLQVSAGLAYTFKDYVQNTAAITNGALVLTPTDHQIGLNVLIHYYPFGLFKLDNTFIGWKNSKSLESHIENRISIVAGIGIPDPLKNYYVGLSEDLLPGVRITFGKHLFLYNKYQVLNNVIDDQASKVQSAGWYASVNFDSDFIGKFIGLFK